MGTPPATSEQTAIISGMRGWAAAYQMPDVAYHQTLTMFEGPIGSGKLHKRLESSTIGLAKGRRNFWRPEGKDGEPLRGTKWKENSIESLRLVKTLAEETTSLKWERWEMARGHRTAVFSFDVSQDHSAWVLSEYGLRTVALSYSGSVYIEPEARVIWQIDVHTTDIPAIYQTRYQMHSERFGYTDLAGMQCVLRLSQTDVVQQRKRETRLELVWSDFRKFAADSSVTFGE